MKQTLVTLTIGQSPRSDILPLLLEHMPEEQIAHAGLLDGLTAAEVEQQFAPQADEKILVSRLQDGSQARLSAAKVEIGLQSKILALEEQGYQIILLLCTGEFGQLRASNALLLEPDRIIPPLIKSIVDSHQVGIVVPVQEQIREQASKWRHLSKVPCFAVASPYLSDDDTLSAAALSLKEQGADVVVLDCIGYHQYHRDFLQKLLEIPVLLSNVLVAKLAAELLV
ncbi:AroM family protein [Erwiniaceae bacterium BAC15a-03b]|uniref:AroM family protein n=1 Tax=Winslowiella arboricola TaxID=2978220 RepID=A0A9J6PHF9_9GAMM|nr:AroM family protein [Winslowiella arboricola]MCU5772070.1 AroM family protein [Winslowiella arboricola]MCU5776142.1 AroM family protein [Winslowiella arboricola]